MSIVTDFKSIKRILDRQEKKAEFEAKQTASFSASRLSGGSCETKTILVADLPTSEEVRQVRLDMLRRWIAEDARFHLPDLRGRVKAD